MIPNNVLEDNAVIGDDKRILRDIHLKSKNIAVYERSIESLKTGLNQLVMQPIEYRVNGTVEEITNSLSTYFTKVLPKHTDLMEDILNLLKLFEQITEVSSFQVSLAKISTTMCPRFHADNNELRMLCTYHGPGTQWLPNYAVNRKAYLSGKDNQKILADENLARQVDTGAVVILKGALYWESNPILHRSPNIEKKAKGRILLSIDINESLSPLRK
ncbi:MAG: DUF1826 domain-containing protein [Bacteroidota bacterium]